MYVFRHELVCVCVVCAVHTVSMCAIVNVWRSEDKLRESVFSFPHWVPWIYL